MKSRNLKVDDYISEYYKKLRYISVYNHVIYLVNGSNLWVRTLYLDVQQPKYGKIPRRPNKIRNLEQGKIDGSDRKMRRTCLIVKCSRCKQTSHNKCTCKMTQPTQPSQANQQTQPNHESEAIQQTKASPTTQGCEVCQLSQDNQQKAKKI